MKTIGDLYSSTIWNEHKNSSLDYFYNYVPKTHLDAIKHTGSIGEIDFDLEKLKRLQNILSDYHKELGLFTPKVRENINDMNKGIVIAGQQATIFGGVSLIANKIAATISLSETAKANNQHLSPVFLVNTHDAIQPEITTIHLPNAQSSNSKPISLSDVRAGVSSHNIMTSDFDWLEENLDVIMNIFNEFGSLLPKNKLDIFSERVNHIITFLRESYRSSKSLGEWVAIIYGVQANIINNYGLILFPTSHPEIRKLLVDGFNPILQNRELYINEFNSATSKLNELGLEPTTRFKESDYSPFFYECENDGYRIPLSCKLNSDILKFEGKCPLDNNHISFSTSSSNPDLSSYACNLAARLDANQITFQSIMPTYIRVSGPGEINYNAQVIPAGRKIGINFPIYLKYTRMIYNADWIEMLGKKEEVKEYSLLSGEFFKLLGVISKARKSDNYEKLFTSQKKLKNYILQKLDSISKTSNNSTSSIEKYKAWQWGIYDEHKKWQEVSYPWFYLASITGLSDYLETYKRQYSSESPVGGIGFINTFV